MSKRELSRVILVVAVYALSMTLGAGCLPNGTHPRAATAASPSSSGVIHIDGRDLPDPLTLNDGTPVTTTDTWNVRRRAELLSLFSEQVYGSILPPPINESFAETVTTFDNAIRKLVDITVSGPYGSTTFRMRLFLPTYVTDTPAPVFLLIDNRNVATDDPHQSTEFFPVSQALQRGYGMAVFYYGDLAPDDLSTYRHGVIDLFYDSTVALPPNAGKAISAWAWGAMRCMDYLMTAPEVDQSRIVFIGHSRGGKTALWAGANDARFTYVISNEAGCSGDALARGKTGERIADITADPPQGFPHWFADNYYGYANHEDNLPVDQHELIALIAPRSVYTASADLDDWADPRSQFMGLIAATSVYNLFSRRGTGLSESDWPVTVNAHYHGDAMAFHERSGAHDLTLFDWNLFMDYLDSH